MTWPLTARGAWWLATDPAGDLHPALIAAMRREGLATDDRPPRLTEKGRAVVARMSWAHIYDGAPLPGPRRGAAPDDMDELAGRRLAPRPPEVPGRRAGRPVADMSEALMPEPAGCFFHLGLGLALAVFLILTALI